MNNAEDDEINADGVTVTLLGVAQDGGVPQCGCSCKRCMDVHEGLAPELFPVSLGITDMDGCFHLVECSRVLAKQLHLWARSLQCPKGLKVVRQISSVSITHLHLGHVDGLGQFGREVMGCTPKSVRLIASEPVIEALGHRDVLDPFELDIIDDGSSVILGKGVRLEFHRVPHREEEGSPMHAIVIRGGKQSMLFLPDHDTYAETLEWTKMDSIRAWLQHLSIDICLLDGTFFTVEEVAGRRSDASGIPHPPISESLQLLGPKRAEDAEIVFIHLNHTNPVIDDPETRGKVTELGWKIGEQGQSWIL
jgi:pyrroloquinoline quinone biosynthesis protein B